MLAPALNSVRIPTLGHFSRLWLIADQPDRHEPRTCSGLAVFPVSNAHCSASVSESVSTFKAFRAQRLYRLIQSVHVVLIAFYEAVPD
jgi:hypothetical protein